MQIAYSIPELAGKADSSRPSVVTIGNFDGVHAGHQALIAAVRARAMALDARSVVLTFEPHPSRLLHSGTATPLITPLPEKLRLLAAQQVDTVLVLPFTDSVRQLSAKDFSKQLLHEGLHTTEVHEGKSFRFGHQAEADIARLAQLGQEFCFNVISHEPVVLRGGPVSSSRIRRLLAQGDVSTARVLLRRPFYLDSTPTSGRGYGSRYAVPTINLVTPTELVPAHGVYITSLDIGEGSAKRSFRGVTNIGNRPTFGADSFAIETHLFDFEPVELTASTPLRLSFLARLRPEQRFENVEALRSQISKDVRNAQRFFQLCNAYAATS